MYPTQKWDDKTAIASLRNDVETTPWWIWWSFICAKPMLWKKNSYSPKSDCCTLPLRKKIIWRKCLSIKDDDLGCFIHMCELIIEKSLHFGPLVFLKLLRGLNLQFLEIFFLPFRFTLTTLGQWRVQVAYFASLLKFTF